jgi:hypothetical protein
MLGAAPIVDIRISKTPPTIKSGAPTPRKARRDTSGDMTLSSYLL